MRNTTSDEALIGQARLGDQAAFGELWRRHYRSGARVARQFTSIDADDLVAEAYTRIFQRVLSGGGPTGAFRPYLYTTIRNLASSWGAASRDVQVDDIEDFEDLSTLDDPAVRALDRTLTARAFRGLPERWQSVLWYTEVEGMDPHEVAPLLGLSANAVAALSYRAREGLRRAWLQAHVADVAAPAQCRWTISRLGDYARQGLTERETERVALHLHECAKCAIIAEEVDEVGSRLALVMFPILLGGTAGGTLLASLGEGSAAVAAAIPAAPASFAALHATAAPVVAGLSGGASGASVLVTSIAVVAALGGAATVTFIPPEHPAVTVESQGETAEPRQPTNPVAPTPVATEVVPGAVPDLVDGVVDVVDVVGGTAREVVDDVDELVDALVPLPASVTLALAGSGTPGATVTAAAGGVVYGTTVVSASGDWSLTADGVPAAVGSVQLSQRLVVLGIEVPLDIPLLLTAGADGITVQLLN